MDILSTVFIALLGGVLPALAWLSFWLREDAHPEPRKLIFKSFLYGMYAVPVALAFQFIINLIFLQGKEIDYAFITSYPIAIFTIIIWATIEEYVKYRAAYNSGIKSRDNDEPIDVMIYMITAALGFSALENTLFIFWPLLAGDSTTAFITGNMRFIGATLLHVATSATIGIFAGLSFYKSRVIKNRHVVIGFVFAVTLHTIFNSFIIRAEKFTLIGFSLVWLSIVAVILFFEKVKQVYIKRDSKINNI